MNIDRINSLALTLYLEAYEANFGGKERGRFLVSREHIKKLLGVPRLHPSTTRELIDACLKLGLVAIDMDDTFAFSETVLVTKWRKLTSRLVDEYTNELDAEDEDQEIDDADDVHDNEEDADDADDNEEDADDADDEEK